MSTTARRRDTTRLDLSRDEQWIVHHVMLRAIEARQDEGQAPPWWALDVIEKLEDRPVDGSVSVDRPFTCYEAWRLRRALASYAERAETPEEDVALAVRVAERLDERFVEPPTALD